MKERNAFFSNVGLYMKLALVTLLMIGGSNFAWGDELTVNDDTQISAYAPIYGAKMGTAGNMKNQFIIPASSLTTNPNDITNKTITKLTFYCENQTFDWGASQIQVYMAEVPNTSYASNDYEFWTPMDIVFNGTISVSDYKLELTLSKPYFYEGGNLLIGFCNTVKGTAKYSDGRWYGIKPSNNTLVYWAATAPIREKFLPKVTFTYNNSEGCKKLTSLSASNITYDSAQLSWTVSDEGQDTWEVVCTSDAEIDLSSATPTVVNAKSYSLPSLSENTTYYAFVRAKCSESSKSSWSYTTFTTPEQYPRPTLFALDTYTGNSATLTWTNGSNEEKWQIVFSTDSDFNPDNEGTIVDVNSISPYTLPNLIIEKTYYAYIRANYNSGYSGWSNKISFTPSYFMEEIVNDNTGSSYSSYCRIPICYDGVANENLTMNQFIIPESALTKLKNHQIVQLTYHATQSSVNWGDATFDIYLQPTTKSSFSTPTFEDWAGEGMTKVATAKNLFVSDKKMVISFDTPFTYTEGNLLIGFKQTSIGTNNTVTWVQAPYNSSNYVGLVYNGTSNTRSYYLPKITISSAYVDVVMGTNGYTTFACPSPLNLTSLPSGLKAYKASSIDGTTVYFTEVNSAVPANTGLLLEGTANTTYNIPVAESGTTVEGNKFEVNSTGGTFTDVDGDDYTYFGLIKDSNPLVFGTFDPSTVAIPANKAYLKVAKANARQLTCVFGDDGQTTGISDASHLMDNGEKRNDNFFNLNGQRVAQPTKGLYIKNGKKVVVK